MNSSTASFLLRSGFTVLSVVVAGIAVTQWLGLTLRQSLLISLPIAFFTSSLITLWAMAKAGSRGNQTWQLLAMLAIELLLVPIASAAAVAAYFIDRQ
ncbi:hypothetical protein Pla123a_15520 [Posidoniimonas polymericola]|uniref:Uncharacterized protein n=1 Tax=Posidoniimonas polymericola TaxID=2528002 RepID=A0A5C5YSA9_9BACT|nr:hypothetical protein [Posidoniimonas polymericola]TWT77756.1 hypothetical protein Pla123a_15520 [Posidoniimonas polymericola]